MKRIHLFVCVFLWSRSKKHEKKFALKLVSGGFHVRRTQLWVRIGLRTLPWWSSDTPSTPGIKQNIENYLCLKNCSQGVLRGVGSVYERESGAEPMEGAHTSHPKWRRGEPAKTVPSNRRTTRSCNNDYSHQFTLMPLSTAKKAAPASYYRISSRWLINFWLINIKRTDGDENHRMGERTISQKFAGLANSRAVGSGGAERCRWSTAHPTSETDSNTEIHETRSANKAKHGYSQIAVFFTT